jgi:hypothetical protein
MSLITSSDDQILHNKYIAVQNKLNAMKLSAEEAIKAIAVLQADAGYTAHASEAEASYFTSAIIISESTINKLLQVVPE